MRARFRPLLVGAGVAVLAGAIALTVIVLGGSGEAKSEPRSQAAPVRHETPGRLIGEVYERLLVGRYGQAWDLLHPAHQAIVTRSRYIECAASWPPTPDLERFEVLEVLDEPISVPLVPQRLSKLVKYRVTVTDGARSDSFESTGHAVSVDGKWRWVLAGPDIAFFRAGECPP